METALDLETVLALGTVLVLHRLLGWLLVTGTWGTEGAGWGGAWWQGEAVGSVGTAGREARLLDDEVAAAEGAEEAAEVEGAEVGEAVVTARGEVEVEERSEGAMG